MAGRSSSDLDHITSEPQSIASLIEGQGDVPLGAVSGGDEDQAALLTYLKTHYSDPTGSGAALGTGDIPSLPTTTYRPAPTPGPVDHKQLQSSEYARASSPPNPSISIPPSLAALAAQSQLSVPSFNSDHQSHSLPSFDGRGEMGGKRRKLPHERAGWKEMDQEPRTRRKRGGRRSDSATNGYSMNLMDEQPSAEHMKHMSTLTMPGDLALANMVDGQVKMPEVDGQQSQAPPPEQVQATDPKESRAAQNRRAQQVFRRKREERMQKLEADAEGYHAARQDLAAAQLQLEAEHIEKMALRVALRNLAQAGTGMSILDTDGGLLIQSGIHPSQGTDTPELIDKAFLTLESQCRELAKSNRSRGL